MKANQILDLCRTMAARYRIECQGPMQVFGFPERIGVRFRDLNNVQGKLIPKATVAFSPTDTREVITEKVTAALICLRYGIQTGWNKAA